MKVGKWEVVLDFRRVRVFCGGVLGETSPAVAAPTLVGVKPQKRAGVRVLGVSIGASGMMRPDGGWY